MSDEASTSGGSGSSARIRAQASPISRQSARRRLADADGNERDVGAENLEEGELHLERVLPPVRLGVSSSDGQRARRRPASAPVHRDVAEGGPPRLRGIECGGRAPGPCGWGTGGSPRAGCGGGRRPRRRPAPSRRSRRAERSRRRPAPGRRPPGGRSARGVRGGPAARRRRPRRRREDGRAIGRPAS